MKAHHAACPISAVTRPELLVGLIAVVALAAVIIPTFQPRGPTYTGKAATVVKNIVNACKAYHNEYGHFPSIPAARDRIEGTPPEVYLSFGDIAEGRCKISNNQLFFVLRAMAEGPNADDALNPRKTRYFEDHKATSKLRPREGFTDGPDFPATARGRLMDPWGTEYCIILDADQDDAINLGAFYQDLAAGEKTVRSSAVAFSLGKDGKRGGKGYEGMFRRPKKDDAPEDVVSWE